MLLSFMNVIFQSFGGAQIKFTLIAWDLSKSWRLTPKLYTWLATNGDMLKSIYSCKLNELTEVDLYCVKHLRPCATDLGYHHWLRLKIICQGCAGKTVQLWHLALLPPPPHESGVVLFMLSVLPSYSQLLLLLCVSCRLCVLIWWSVTLPGCVV